jgi:NAD(P)-dependent dehydrogenase (short-subunit alcohol dehydrogenase family)
MAVGLRGKRIAVTGAGGFLGTALCRELVDQGASVMALDIKPDWEHPEIAVDYRQMDTTSEDAVARLVAALPAVDGWVNNAYPRTADWALKFEEIPMSSWRKNIDLHLNGYAMCCQVVLEKMKAQGHGALVNMASIYGSVGPDFTVYEGTAMTMPAAYAAIKGGIANMTRYLASYYGLYNVRVNCVSPGGVFDHQPESFVKRYCEKVPMRRMATPEDIVGGVAFLLSDSAGYITGHDLKIDGGWCAI